MRAGGTYRDILRGNNNMSSDCVAMLIIIDICHRCRGTRGIIPDHGAEATSDMIFTRDAGVTQVHSNRWLSEARGPGSEGHEGFAYWIESSAHPCIDTPCLTCETRTSRSHTSFVCSMAQMYTLHHLEGHFDSTTTRLRQQHGSPLLVLYTTKTPL